MIPFLTWKMRKERLIYLFYSFCNNNIVTDHGDSVFFKKKQQSPSTHTAHKCTVKIF